MGAKGMVFRAWVHKRHHKTHNGRYVLRIDGADFLHFWVTDWGKPERAPHKREVRAICLSVCLSFCPYIHDMKIYKSNQDSR